MSITNYTIVNTGLQFKYDNTNHGIMDADGNYMTPEWHQPSDWEDMKVRYGQLSKSKTPETIKITLGHGCNYSCGYCMQKDIGNPDERQVNGMTPILMEKLARHLDMNSVSRIELWGGETLLYWKDIVQLLDRFDRPGVTWYIPTNGTPLQDKHVDKFLSLQGDVAIGISHDGPGHERTRGPEFLHKKVEVLRRIQREGAGKIQFSFNPVISASNYDLFELDRFFSTFLSENGLDQVLLSFELGRVYDSTLAVNSTHHVITGEHIGTYKTILRNYLTAHLEQFRQHGSTKSGKLLANSLFHNGSGVLPYAQTLATRKAMIRKTNCGVDDSSLISMDIAGNVRACQNTDDRYNAGNIMMLKGVRIHHVNINRDARCGECHVRPLCKSSCPLDLGPEVHNINCSVEKVHYTEIQLAAFNLLFNSEVQLG